MFTFSAAASASPLRPPRRGCGSRAGASKRRGEEEAATRAAGAGRSCLPCHNLVLAPSPPRSVGCSTYVVVGAAISTTRCSHLGATWGLPSASIPWRIDGRLCPTCTNLDASPPAPLWVGASMCAEGKADVMARLSCPRQSASTPWHTAGSSCRPWPATASARQPPRSEAAVAAASAVAASLCSAARWASTRYALPNCIVQSVDVGRSFPT
mmetsp:Transcript_40715/g.131158  ORF Transcript_40715/g.131158 Transcript_40715/m.131158 type:complete len:211 (-) Transcript_40715:438-1070(-)